MLVTDLFVRLSEDKQQLIINAGFQAFAKNGYKKTAVNDIAQIAKISKASLFQYFVNKKNIYLYLYEFSKTQIARNMHEGNDDLFDCIALSTVLKFEVMKKYPYMDDFLRNVIKEEQIIDDKMLVNDCQIKQMLSNSLFKNVNWHKLKIQPEEVFNLLRWVSEGCIKDNIDKSAEEIISMINVYLEIIKQAVYKEEYL